MKSIYYFKDGRKDEITTWINNSKWSWVVLVVLIIIAGFVEGI